MTASAVLRVLIDLDLVPEITPDGQSLSFPAGELTDELRAAVKANKPQILASIRESAAITAQLLDAAMRACDHWGDGPQSREQMRQDILNTPPHQRADLLAHFKHQYPS